MDRDDDDDDDLVLPLLDDSFSLITSSSSLLLLVEWSWWILNDCRLRRFCRHDESLFTTDRDGDDDDEVHQLLSVRIADEINTSLPGRNENE